MTKKKVYDGHKECFHCKECGKHLTFCECKKVVKNGK